MDQKGIYITKDICGGDKPIATPNIPTVACLMILIRP